MTAPRALSAVKRLLTDQAARYELLLRFGLLRGGFQSSAETSADRYPGIFAFVQSTLGAEREARILSFGCSAGDEILTLGRYFPNARIHGIDINPGTIATCRQRLKASGDARLTCATASSTTSEPDGAYDAIFCMAVFRHGNLTPDTPTCLPYIRFEDFARVTADLHRCLAPGGLLAIRYSNFRLSDAPIASGFEAVHRGPEHDPIALYGPDNMLIPGAVYRDCVFSKL